MEEVSKGIASAYDCTVDFAFHRNYPPTVNSESETQLIIDLAAHQMQRGLGGCGGGRLRLQRHDKLLRGEGSGGGHKKPASEAGSFATG